MSVIADSAIVPRMWRGFDDPSYPVGTYISNFVIIGDATGGNMQIQFPFKIEGAPATGLLYNIEQISAFVSVNTGIPFEAFIRILAFEALGPFIIGDRSYRFDLQGGSSVLSMGTNFPPMPLFLGASARLASSFSVVQIGTGNLNATILSIDIQGYVWEPRSILAEGGVKRPADNLYGR